LCLKAIGVPIAVREAVASYRADRGLNDWFHLDIPMTSDKIRMAAKDEYVETIEKVAKKVPLKEKIGFGI